jgi:hypothetical protein
MKTAVIAAAIPAAVVVTSVGLVLLPVVALVWLADRRAHRDSPSPRGRTPPDLRQDGGMADRYTTPDGWTIEVVQLAEGDRLRISHHGFYIADVLSVDDLGRWMPAAELAQLERGTLILAA